MYTDWSDKELYTGILLDVESIQPSLHSTNKEPNNGQDSDMFNQNQESAERVDESSDDNLPLLKLQDKLRKQKRNVSRKGRKQEEMTIKSPAQSEDNDETYLPSDTSKRYSSCGITLVAEKRRKWVRKQMRPLRRHEGIKCARRLKSTKNGISVKERCLPDLQQIFSKAKERKPLYRR